MFLINCGCGCFFTLKESCFDIRVKFRCPNCAASVCLDHTPTTQEIQSALKDAGMSIRQIPDNAKIAVSFEL